MNTAFTDLKLASLCTLLLLTTGAYAVFFAAPLTHSARSTITPPLVPAQGLEISSLAR